MKLIDCGVVVAVSDEDFDDLSQFSWRPIGKYVCTTMYMHRYIANKFLDISGYPERVVDHIDENKMNNTRENLRVVSFIDNVRNLGLRSNNKTGFRGVSRKRNSFLANIGVGSWVKYIGSYPTPEEAARAYDRYAKLIFGENFSQFNFPSEVKDIIVPTMEELMR
jgi:hypothetical protein